MNNLNLNTLSIGQIIITESLDNGDFKVATVSYIGDTHFKVEDGRTFGVFSDCVMCDEDDSVPHATHPMFNEIVADCNGTVCI